MNKRSVVGLILAVGAALLDTPGSDDRGARRIVIGEGGEVYYTEDHYQSFWRVLR